MTEVIRELRGLNEPVPRPPRLPTEDEVGATEARLGVRFHEDYRRYLLKAGDVTYGTLEPAVVVPGAGYRSLAEVAETAWEHWGVPRGLLPICEDNADYYCMNEAGEVVFWSHDGGTDERWPNLATWIKRVWIEGN